LKFLTKSFKTKINKGLKLKKSYLKMQKIMKRKFS